MENHESTASIAQKLNNAGFEKKLDVWVHHELMQENLTDRISICQSLLNQNRPISEPDGNW